MSMLFIALFFFELLILFLLSRTLSVELSYFFQRLSGSRRFSMFLLALLFFPGTFVHEISHFLIAKLLFVHTGRITLWPKMETARSVTMGSVEVAKTDLIRNFFIGIAPFMVGSVLVIQILWYATTHNIFANKLILFLLGYLLFVVGNTMFSSKKDMEGALLFYILVSIFIGAGYFFGLRVEHIAAFISSQENILNIIRSAVILLLVPIAIDVVVIIIAKAVNSIRFL